LSTVTLESERQYPAVLRQHERVDLDEARVEPLERLVQVHQRPPDALRGVAFEARGEGDLAHLVGQQPEQRVHVRPHDGLGLGLGDLLDVHPALGREQDEGPLGRPIDGNGEVELLLYLRPALDVHPPDGVPPDVHPEYALGGLARFGGVVYHRDAPGLAAAADQHLRLHRDGPPERLGRPGRLLRRAGHDARKRLQVVVSQQLLP
jgi:hypothetical protein